MTESGAATATRTLRNLKALKACRAGERVTFRGRVLRLWEIGGLRMCLIGDRSALTRVELGSVAVDPGRSYSFRDAVVREYPGGWHSASLAGGGGAEALARQVAISQSDEYIERTFKILAGVQRKRARREGREEPWRHPAATERRG